MIVPPPPASSVAFVDADHGWIGDSAGLFATSDGRRFQVIARTPISGISAVDKTHVWALSGGSILRTADARHWQSVTAPRLVSIEFLDARNGFGLTRAGAVLKTADAGENWAPVRTPAPMQAQCFSSTRDGWVARSRSVWTTRDGGASWTRRRLAPKLLQQALPALQCRGSSVWVLFAGGAAAGSQGYEVFRSLDAGQSWRAILAGLVSTTLPRINAYSGPFVALGGGGAIFEGACGACVLGRGSINFVRTRDGGRTFTRATPQIHSFGGAMSFVDARRGWLLTRLYGDKKQRLLSTRDGGAHWRRVATIP